MRTLNDQAVGADGTPLAPGRAVKVELLDERGVSTEEWTLTGTGDADALAKWAGDYVMCMAAEGMGGSVRWSEIEAPDELAKWTEDHLVVINVRDEQS